MNTHTFKDWTIKIYNDTEWHLSAVDTNAVYAKHYYAMDDWAVESSARHGIRIYEHGNEINSCLLHGYGGATAVFGNSSLQDGDQLLVCCGNTLFCLGIPTLEKRWEAAPDLGTCFEVYLLEDTYLVHGEMSVVRLDKAGNVLWSFSGYDIFVTLEDEEDFSINDEYILLKDFSGNSYRLDFDGQELSLLI